MEKPVALGVDIGGSHITAALVDLETRTIVHNSIERNAIDSQESKEVILTAWCEIITKAFEKSPSDVKLIGIAMPGPFDYEQGISLIKDQDKFKALYGVNIKDELSKRLNIDAANIQFINDAAGFLQGEVFGGAGRGNSNVLGLTLGTGLGSAYCVGGVAKDADLWNSPFLNGIAEDYLSTRWFVKRYQQLSNNTVAGVKELTALTATDYSATRVFMEFGYNLAQFLMPVIKKNKSDVVIIGGNISGAFAAFSPELIATLKGNAIDADIRVTKLKEHAALIGAASCCDVTFRHENTTESLGNEVKSFINKG
ncbi:ROK family protein [Pedobacter jejuensis]|uniref:ROK family protein n=1 Tax=Pedobacter jejuensis TaxID=1268550 RepID=A0A3N0C032_9SPHI|nr:ROK family protein [Pedobacter jejuensis]RNL55539.1 ROK family protein [Pedobacter jejuensis]